MKKTSIFLGMCISALYYTQQGNVGINTTTPNATLDVKVNELIPQNTNQGLLVPRISKQRVSQMPSPETSTLVYVNDASYSSSDAKITHIKSVGFYYYNGTTWVRLFNNTDAIDAKTILNGNTDPIASVGEQGDFYINTTTHQIFGPKTTTWGTGTSLKGAKGDTGPQGPAGPNIRAIVQQGTNVTVTGDGSSGNPYIISSAGGNDTSIYLNNGTLPENRNVDLNNKKLAFYGGIFEIIGSSNNTLRMSSASGPASILFYPSGNGNDLVSLEAHVGGSASLSAGNGYVYVQKAGNVGIGTMTPSSKLEVNGDIRTNAVIYKSDARFKQNINNIENATENINKLRAVTYHWNKLGKEKGGDNTLQYGFIAQEIEKVFPNLVNTDTQGYKSVNYVAVVPILVKALQEKDLEIQQLKEEVEKIKQALKK